MVKLVTVLEKHICKRCNGTAGEAQNASCEHCKGKGTVEVEVVR